jgi:hypothetical protein
VAIVPMCKHFGWAITFLFSVRELWADKIGHTRLTEKEFPSLADNSPKPPVTFRSPGVQSATILLPRVRCEIALEIQASDLTGSSTATSGRDELQENNILLEGTSIEGPLRLTGSTGLLGRSV